MIALATLLAAVQATPAGPPEPAAPAPAAASAVPFQPRPTTVPSIAQPGSPRASGMPAQRMQPGATAQAPHVAVAPARPASPAVPAPAQTLPHAVLPAARPAASTPSREQVLAAVRAEFPSYDTRHQGRLGPLEFGTWVMRANGAAVQPPGARRDAGGMKPVTAINATSRAFAKADANHDGGVTPEELAAFLTARPAGSAP